MVRVGGYAVGCTPDLSVNAVVVNTTFKNTTGTVQKYGDVDSNGVIENTDRAIFAAPVFSFSVPPLTPDTIKAADLNGDRAFTNADTLHMDRYLSDPTNYKFPVYTYASSCTYDYNYDGVIDTTDAGIVNFYFGKDVSESYYYTIYDLNKDGRIDFNDSLDLLDKYRGSC